MNHLPEKFLQRMQQQLGSEYDAFLSCYEQDGYAGIRVNTSKISVEDFLKITPFHLTPVPWTDNGFYYNKEEPVTRHPHYYAGLYYVQEPSAMLPASRLPVSPGDTVLDLCAAPGGKATELSSRLGGSGLLLANDASASRAKALVKNLACWGSSNSCITGEQPEKLLEACGPCFDRILVDAPCSGEGMFRRDAGLISAWTERGPQAYADTQKRILDCAVQMLRPGGILAYSTCTFSEEEDEEVICHTLQMHPELSLIPAASCEGFAEGRTPFEACLRLWPHRIQGEGHFFALLQKAEGGTDHRLRAYTGAELRQSHRRMPQEMASFLEKIPQSLWQDRKYEQIGEQCMLLPPYHLPQKLRYLRTGIWAGTCKKGRFEPSPALALLLGRKDYPSVLDLSSGDERVIRYLKGETLDLTDEEERTVDGWTLVCTDGFGLGWGKAAGGRLKNKYYPGWRLL